MHSSFFETANQSAEVPGARGAAHCRLALIVHNVLNPAVAVQKDGKRRHKALGHRLRCHDRRGHRHVVVSKERVDADPKTGVRRHVRGHPVAAVPRISKLGLGHVVRQLCNPQATCDQRTTEGCAVCVGISSTHKRLYMCVCARARALTVERVRLGHG